MGGDTRWGKRSRHDDPEQAREHILQATYRTIVTKGVEKASISEIAKQAKVSRPTIYRYFDSREDIIKSLFVRRRDEFFDEMYRATLDFREDFPRLVEQCLCFAVDYGKRSDKTFDLVSGPNAGNIRPFVAIEGTYPRWMEILEQPYRDYVKTTGNALDLSDLVGFMGNMILLIRAYPMDREVLKAQLRALMALGKVPG